MSGTHKASELGVLQKTREIMLRVEIKREKRATVAAHHAAACFANAAINDGCGIDSDI